MSIAYLVGKFGSGLAPGTVPAPAPITGHAVIRYSTLLQLTTSPGLMIPVTSVRLPIVDGVLCSATGVPSTTTPIAVQATDDPLLAQSGAVFARIDLIFDGGAEPVQAILDLPTGATVDLATAARAGGTGSVFVSGLTPLQLTELHEGMAEVTAERALAEQARTAAEAARDAAVAVSTADLDPAAAVLVGSPSSALRVALDAKYVASFSGTYAARPAATAVPKGAMYYATDVPEQYRSTGTAWVVTGSGGNELASAVVLTNTTSTTAAYADVPGLSATFVVGERPILLAINGVLGHTNGDYSATAGIFLDGVELATATPSFPGTGVGTFFGPTGRTVRKGGLVPGSTHTAKVAFKNPSATGTATLYGTATQPFELSVVTR